MFQILNHPDRYVDTKQDEIESFILTIDMQWLLAAAIISLQNTENIKPFWSMHYPGRNISGRICTTCIQHISVQMVTRTADAPSSIQQ